MEKPVVTVCVVAAVVLKKDGKYLLVQEKQPKAYGLWNLPAGKVDIGETIEEAAVREAREESGFVVKILRKLDIYQAQATEWPKHVFEGEIIRGELKFPKAEMLDARWFSFEEIKIMKDKLRAPWILEALTSFENRS